ncbi:MAG TPA: universal stress protein [Methanosarcina barkeri]|nr:universal stress protein [Methanosarcina barkeri]
MATDGSESSKFAVDTGIELAHLSGTKIQAVYVIDIFAYSSMPQDPRWEEGDVSPAQGTG